MTPQNEKGGAVDRFPLVPEGSADVPGLVSVVRRLVVARSMREIMETVTHPARTLLRAGGVTFVLREGDLCYYAEEDAISPLWKGKRFPMDACISGWCMRERRSVVIRDIYEDPRIPQDAYRPTFVQSLAMVPVCQDDPIAAMGAYWPDVREIYREQVDLLQTVANAAALAIANVDLRQTKENREDARRELSHRIKNMFSIVQALANQTAGGSVDEYRTALMGRLHALEQAHTEVFVSQTETADLGALLGRLLFPLVEDESARLELSGPRVSLSRERAADVAFIVNELGTNAVKYGALSLPRGRVRVRWERREDRLELSWKEVGGPLVRPPERRGFGTALIEGIAAHHKGGSSVLSYDPDGVHCRLSLPC